MKVLCINNFVNGTNIFQVGISINKIYDVIEEDDSEYRIINDDIKNIWYLKSRFILLSEIREEKLNQLEI